MDNSGDLSSDSDYSARSESVSQSSSEYERSDNSDAEKRGRESRFSNTPRFQITNDIALITDFTGQSTGETSDQAVLYFSTKDSKEVGDNGFWYCPLFKKNAICRCCKHLCFLPRLLCSGITKLLCCRKSKRGSSSLQNRGIQSGPVILSKEGFDISKRLTSPFPSMSEDIFDGLSQEKQENWVSPVEKVLFTGTYPGLASPLLAKRVSFSTWTLIGLCIAVGCWARLITGCCW